MNTASLVGVILWVMSFPMTFVGGAHLWFVVMRRADTSPFVLLKALWTSQLLGFRVVIPPLLGSVLFFQGWRLDPALQIPAVLLALGILCEAITSVAADYYKWRYRLGRAKASIITESQPSDLYLQDQNGERREW